MDSKLNVMFKNLCCSRCKSDFGEESIEVLRQEDAMLVVRLNCVHCGKSFGRICYGFGRDEDGYVYIKEDEADVVRMIYDMVINGHSLQNIQEELYNLGIKSPSGKDKWTRDVIDKTINNK